jgi:hypothetical protein
MDAADLILVRDALHASTRRRVPAPDLCARLERRLALLFPDALDLADLPPPLVAHRVALSLGLSPGVAVPLTEAACYYYAAADLADDLVDEPVPGLEGQLALNDVCALLFLFQLAALEIPHPHAPAVARLFLEGGLTMAAGQMDDLRFTDAPGGDPVSIARRKTGGELGALLAAPALLAGLDPAPFATFGREIGALVQVFTDYLDLFAKENSDDWRAAKPTLPIRHALAHPRLGPTAARLLAGARRSVSRQQAARWCLIAAGTARAWRTFADERLRALEAAVHQADTPAVLRALLDETRELTFAVDDALAALGEAPPPEAIDPDLPEELAGCRRAARAFLDADPLADEATEHHRWGLFGRATVVANLFGQLVVAEHLRAAGEPPERFARCAAAALSRRDPDGWRYYPGQREIPPDADLTGLALQVLTAQVPGDAEAIAFSLAALRRDQLADGTLPTWLTNGAREPAASDADAQPGPLPWMGERCPASMANAVLGWHRARPADPDLQRAVERLAAWYDADESPPSAFYGPVVVEALGLLCLSACAPGRYAAVEARLVARLRARRQLSGEFGTVLETAFAAIALAAVGALDAPEVVQRALVDAQGADGGYPACPFYVTVGAHHEPGTFGARCVTTALVLRALRAAEGGGVAG